MYAIRSKKTNRWFVGIDARFGKGSSLHIHMDEQIPTLFKSKQLARIEFLTSSLSENAFEILEVDVLPK
ncbi:MAG: hypothetical protein RR252_06995 [Longicatena sp.]